VGSCACATSRAHAESCNLFDPAVPGSPRCDEAAGDAWTVVLQTDLWRGVVDGRPQAVADTVDVTGAAATAHLRREFAVRLLIIAAVLAASVALWSLSTLFLLVFASILVALLLRGISEPLSRLVNLPQPWVLGFTVLFFVVAPLATALLFGATVTRQFSGLVERMPVSLQSLETQLDLPSDWQDWIGLSLRNFIGISGLTRLAADATGALGSILLAFVAGVYLAAQPTLYIRGLLALFPPALAKQVSSFVDTTGTALRHWLVGQLIIMLLVGLLTGLGAFLIGLPSWAALGMIAGLLEFVPYVGPVATGIPATLLALPKGLETVLWTLSMIVAVQQLEGLIITPLVQRQAVSLPPALTLFALIGMGILFGVAGVLLATPLTILLYVGMRDIYIPMIHQDGISLQEPKTLRM